MQSYTQYLPLVLVALAGCQPVPQCNDLDELTEDRNGNGFPEIPPPPGVVIGSDNTIKVFTANTLTAADLAPHSAEAGIPPFVAEWLVGLVDFVVYMELRAEYEDGTIITVCDTEPLGTFEKKFEAACPADAELTVELIAVVPWLNVAVATFPVGLTLDVVDYECGDTVQLITTKDARGNPV